MRREDCARYQNLFSPVLGKVYQRTLYSKTGNVERLESNLGGRHTTQNALQGSQTPLDWDAYRSECHCVDQAVWRLGSFELLAEGCQP